MQTKNATGNLVNRYKAVLKKCALLNVFGSLALVSLCCASPAFALENPSGTTIGILETFNQSDTLTNNGTLTGEAKTVTFYDIDPSGQPMPVTFTAPVGMLGHATDAGDFSFTLKNTGTIAFEGVGGMAVFSQNGNHLLENTGTIELTSADDINGITGDILSGTLKAINSGTITITSGVNAEGMYLEADAGTVTLVNSGTVDATSDANADGMDADNGNDTTTKLYLTNEVDAVLRVESFVGSNVATFESANATGINADENAVIVNNGKIKVTSNATSNINMQGFPIAIAGIKADDNAQVTNTGKIKVTSSDIYAFGMIVGNNSTVSNIGCIKLSASKGFSAEVMGIRTNANLVPFVYNVGDWATSLYDRGANEAVFAVWSGDTINFNGGTLIVRPGTKEQNFKYDTEYAIADMATGYDLTTMTTAPVTLTGAFKGVATENPFLEATLTGKDATTQKVKIIKNTTAIQEETPAGSVGTANIGVANLQMTNISTAISTSIAPAPSSAGVSGSQELGMNSGSDYSIPKWTVFATPYGLYTDNSKYKFDVSSFGVTGGVSYNFNKDFSFGAHIDFNGSNSDSDTVENNSTSFAFGLHSNYFVMDNVYVSAQATVAFGSNDIEYTLANNTAEDDFNSTSFFGKINAGYIFKLNESNIIIPEIGLSYLHTESDAYDFNFANASVYNMNIHSSDYMRYMLTSC